MKLTYAQRRALRDLRDYGDLTYHVYGQSAHGGAVQTRTSLVRRGLIEWVDGAWHLTVAGLDAAR